ncbi:MAG: ABC transporter permease subunit [Eubacteriales bacterium]|nr:ABC transporter permease subunit [Eubacteriales bacterium]
MVLNKSGRFKRIRNITLVILFWFAVWQIVSLIVNQPLLMPSPSETFSSLGMLLVTSKFWLSVAFTFYRVVFGLAISVVTGIVLAFMASRSAALDNLLRPVVAAIKSTPVMSIIVLALVWFSESFVPVFSCVLLCFPIFYTNTLTGIRSVSGNLLEMSAVFRVRRKRVIKEVIIPSVLPHVYSALSVCLGFSWKSVVAAEVLSSPKYSMGFNLYATKLYLNTAELFAWTLTIIVISLIVEKGLKGILPKGNTL